MDIPSTKPSWTLEDLIDLEYYLYQDGQRSQGPDTDSLHINERRFYVNIIKPRLKNHPGTIREKNKIIMRYWLDFRRKLEPSSSHGLPGDLYRQTYAFAVLLFIVMGFCSGAGLSFSFLTYKGDTPLNVSSYLGIFILPQLILLLMVFLFLFFRRFNVVFNHFSLIRFGVYSLVSRLIFWVKKRSERHLSAEKKLAFQSALGVIRGKSRHYKEIFPWPIFALTQIFAVFFNVGILTATLLRVVGSDLAFGWQSTLTLSSVAVHKAVTFISAPWAWGVPEQWAHPSMAQIEGSRIILKDGISRLSTTDLTAWWTFLCFAVLVYGFFPRLILLAGSAMMKQSALNKLTFNSISLDKVLRRLTSPALDTKGENSEPPSAYQDIPVCESPEKPGDSYKPFTALVPEDISDQCPEDLLSEILVNIMGAPLKQKVTVTLHMDDDKSKIQNIISDATGQVILLLESWQAPIREYLNFIQAMMSIGGDDFILYILFTGRPSDDTIFTPSDDHDLLIWKQKINALASPNISIEVIPAAKPSMINGTTHHA